MPDSVKTRMLFFFGSGELLLDRKGLKLTRLAGCVGLWRESVNFLDIQKVETLILVISGLH